MSEILFYLLSALTLACALLVVVSRNPINAAMFLIVSFLGVASLFLFLDAFFLAAVQVLVYAGAVVVLFLFIIMLLDVKEESRRKVHKLSVAAGIVSFLLLGGGVMLLFQPSRFAATPPLGEVAHSAPPLRAYGDQLFTTYLLPMQVVGFLLLIAMIGVIVLSKKIAAPPSPSASGQDSSQSPS